MSTLMSDDQFVLVAAALASPHRLHIVQSLRHTNGLIAGDDEISEHGVSQSAIVRLCAGIAASASARHLNALTTAGVLIRTSASHGGNRRTFYRRNERVIEAFAYTVTKQL